MRPKIIYFRRNIVDELVSRRVAAKSGIFHVKNQKDASTLMQRQLVTFEKPENVAWELLRRVQHRKYVKSKLESLDVEVLNLEYDDCIKDMPACMERTEKFLEVNTHSYDYNTFFKSIGDSVDHIVQNYADVLSAVQQKGLEHYLSEEWIQLSSRSSSDDDNNNATTTFLPPDEEYLSSMEADMQHTPLESSGSNNITMATMAAIFTNNVSSSPISSHVNTLLPLSPNTDNNNYTLPTLRSFVEIVSEIHAQADSQEHHRDLRAVHMQAQQDRFRYVGTLSDGNYDEAEDWIVPIT